MCKEDTLFHYLDSGIQTDGGVTERRMRIPNHDKQKLKQKKARHKNLKGCLLNKKPKMKGYE